MVHLKRIIVFINSSANIIGEKRDYSLQIDSFACAPLDADWHIVLEVICYSKILRYRRCVNLLSRTYYSVVNECEIYEKKYAMIMSHKLK